MLITAYSHTSVAHCAVIYAALPFVTAFLGWGLLGEIPASRALWTSCFALLGVCIMVASGSDGSSW
ncbi:hypothetical protein JJB09_25415 [Rhizobium sp. KVB221]|uniref:EamA domain-containing protein n=2 Tax=Rhizobium setariae TaxID=2801340 RepID=A0A936YR87_9HYPH|nr:hypothetical protein [Rhizobium setariae]